MDALLISLLLLIILKRRKRRRIQNHRRQIHRRHWVHPILTSRNKNGQHKLLFEELKCYPDKFFKYFRMSVNSFNELLSVLHDDLKHQDTRMRKSISPTERLAITLRYLATGCSFGDFELVYRCGASTARLIVKETCKLIYASLQDICVPQPTEEMWSKIAKGFEEYANFPNCCGAIDGKHIRIIKPQDSGSLYYNYKHYFSIVLLAICDVNYKFTFIDVGSYGKASDSTIYKESKLFKKLEDQSLNLPAPKAISSSSGPVNYCFVGDEAFGLAEHMLRPYSGKHLNIEKRIFNYRLSQARRHIECAFGILVNKWRILHRPLNVSIDFAEDIVKACCILHNFVRQRDGFNFHHTLTVPGLQDIDNAHVQSRRSLNTRDILKDYFISNEGAVPWQNNKI
ncbi:protein ALP1-like isoform X1 [Spodoptera litura]|uniref:Protein ALP1-like isoform X1 n=1 Tax=Spodoptera litura TaxID=69820 RepID=A0A9J7EUA6_SPOLT|nr:protein ALP1-like isoform X1 [Spodoptera litura]